MAVVYIISKNGKPLMPTTRCGHVRALLKEKKARVVDTNPFTIQLTYDTKENTQPLTLGIDPGRTNIGVSVVKGNGECVFSAQLSTRNKEIPKLMKARKGYRMAHRRLDRRCKRQRRAKAAKTVAKNKIIKRILPGCEEPIYCKWIRNKQAKFMNRTRPAGWLTPTANHLLLTHLNLIKKLQKLLPITDVVMEVNKFAFMQLDNQNIHRWEYQNGPLKGKKSVEDAVFDMQEGHCLFCDAPIEEYHHVVSRKKNGSETIENRAGLCKKHHRLVHTEEEWEKKLAKKKAGLNKKYHALSVLNQIIPRLSEELAVLFPEHTFVTTGQDTAGFRKTHVISKDHHLDAYCIACSVLEKPNKVSEPTGAPYQMMQFRRHDRQACHKANISRKYYDKNGKLVATNRHKAMDQQVDSLEEYWAQHEEKAVCGLTVKPHFPAYKDIFRVMPGSLLKDETGTIFTMLRSDGKHNGVADYFIDTQGEKHLAKRCILLQKNQGIIFAKVG